MRRGWAFPPFFFFNGRSVLRVALPGQTLALTGSRVTKSLRIPMSMVFICSCRASRYSCSPPARMRSTELKSSSARSRPITCSEGYTKEPMGLPVMACKDSSAQWMQKADGARKIRIHEQKIHNIAG